MPAALAQNQPQFGSSDWDFEFSKSLGLELAQIGAWPYASKYFERIGHLSQDWHLQGMRARALLQLGKVTDAKFVIQKAREINPDNPRLLLLAGQIASDSKDQEEAIAYFKRCLELQPNNEQAATALGRILYQTEAWSELIEVYERLLSRQSKPGSDILLRLATAHEKLGNIQQSETYLKLNLAQHSNRMLALTTLERFYQRQSKDDKILEIQKEIAKLRAKSDRTRELRNLAPSWR